MEELNEKELLKIVDFIPGGISLYEYTGQGVVTRYYSKGMERLTGFLKEECELISGTRGYARVHKDDRKSVVAEVSEGINSGKEFSTSYRFLRKDGEYIWLNIQINPVQTEDGRILFYTVFTDVSEIRRQESLLRENEENLRIQQRKSEICQKEFGIKIWEYDLEKDVHIYDGVVQEYENREEWKTFLQHIPKESIRTYEDMLKRLHEGERNIGADLQLVNRRGETKWYHIHYVTILSRWGERTLTAIGMSRKLDEYRELELEFQREIVRRNIEERKCVITYRVNITKEEIEDIIVSDPQLEHLKNVRNPVELLENLKMEILEPEKKDEVDELIRELRQMRILNEKRKKIELVYSRKLPNKYITYMKVEITVIKKPSTDELIGFIYVRDVSKSMFTKIVMDSIMDSDYDYLAIANVEQEDVCMMELGRYYSQYGTRTRIEKYEEHFEPQIQKIPENEREAARTVMEFSRVKKELEDKESYVLSFSYQSSSGELRRKKWIYSYLDPTKHIILVRREDVTEVYKQRQLQEIRLREALSKAEEANQAKSRFLSNMSHDMRTPMNAIIGFSDELSTKDAGEEELRNMLHQVNISGKYLLCLINDVLDMSRIENKKMVLRQEPLLLTQIFHEIGILVDVQMKEKKIHFSIQQQEEENTAVMCDRMYIKQVLMNLLANAVKFTPEGGTVSCEQESVRIDEKHVKTTIVVRDNGIGMSEEFIPRIFDAFEQENKADKESYTGTGLGMAIVKAIIDLMGGTIEVKSKKGEGTEFTIILEFQIADLDEKEKAVLSGKPQMEKKAESGTKEEETGKKKELKIPDLSGKRILLCEDHPINAMVARKLLKATRCEMEHAENGLIGLERFENSPMGYYDLILMDIRMPVLDGIETAKAIRRLKREDAGDIPIIAMTANAFVEDIEKSLAAGMNAHIGKPVEPMVLYQKLMSLIR